MLEEIKRLADEYGLADKTILKYYHMLLTVVESRPELDETDEEKIVSCLERITSERSSIEATTRASELPYTLEQTVQRAIAEEYGLGITSDAFTDEEKYRHFIYKQHDKSVEELHDEIQIKLGSR